ncbi:hypothetical protein MMC14_010805, partial [Varicellaria rhodocarpa]|nr:hypothetical protein [Varicellaria rhodocarpa]
YLQDHQLRQYESTNAGDEFVPLPRINSNPVGRDLAVSAVARAQLRHRRRLKQCSESAKDLQDNDSLLNLSAFPHTSSADTLRQLDHAQPRLDRKQEAVLVLAMTEGRRLIATLRLQQQNKQQTQAPNSALTASNVATADALRQLHAAQVRPHVPCHVTELATSVSRPPDTVMLHCIELAFADHTALLQVARRRLVQAHLWLVSKAVSAYKHQKQVSQEDLVHAGLNGLSTALDKFDASRGNRVSTVAYMWIKEAVTRAYYDSAWTIKISERARTNVNSSHSCTPIICGMLVVQMRKVVAAQEQLPEEQKLSLEHLHRLTGLSRHTAGSALQACSLKELSLEASLESPSAVRHAGTHTPFGDQLSSGCMLDNPSDLIGLHTSETHAAESLIEGALQQLPQAEAVVLHHVYGLQDGLPKSRPEVCQSPSANQCMYTACPACKVHQSAHAAAWVWFGCKSSIAPHAMPSLQKQHSATCNAVTAFATEADVLLASLAACVSTCWLAVA